MRHTTCVRLGRLFPLWVTVLLAGPAASSVDSLPLDTAVLRPGARIATIALVASDESVTSENEWRALDKLNAQLRRYTSYSVMSVAESRTRLAAAKFLKTSECVDEKCLAEAGRILNVDYAVAAWVGTTDTMPVLSAALVDVTAKRTIRFVRRDVPDGIRSVDLVSTSLVAALVRGEASLQARDSSTSVDSSVVVTFISDPPGAQVTLDDSILGLTPLTRDSVSVGPHRIVASLKGYRTFSKTVTIPPGKEKRVKFRLTQTVNRLAVTSQPSGATVILNDSARGVTPFVSTTIRPDVYRLKVDMKYYIPYLSEVTVYGKEPTSVSCVLTSKAYADSVRRAHQRAFKFTRRIIFATGASAFVLAGMLYNGDVADALEKEDQAYQAYNVDGLTQTEYDTRWLDYQQKHTAAGGPTRSRNAMYVLGILCAVGFTISIPF